MQLKRCASLIGRNKTNPEWVCWASKAEPSPKVRHTESRGRPGQGVGQCGKRHRELTQWDWSREPRAAPANRIGGWGEQWQGLAVGTLKSTNRMTRGDEASKPSRL